MWQPSYKETANQSIAEKNLTEGNQAYAASFNQGHLALPPSQKYAICKWSLSVAHKVRCSTPN